jgi:choline dehydrogenase-like flavoprotein
VKEEDVDVIVVGSGAGGSTAAATLARSGLEVRLLEKGVRLPKDGSTLDPELVVTQAAFKSREVWQGPAGEQLVPEEWFNLGGKTKWYGAALARFGADEFGADRDRLLRAWPFGREDLDPYYERVESTLRVRHFDSEPDLARILARLEGRNGWRAVPLPLGLEGSILADAQEARHFDGFASPSGKKADAEARWLDPIRDRANLRIETSATVVALIGERGPRPQVTGVHLADGRTLCARAVVLAAGALHSPRLLQTFLDRCDLKALPAARHVGRNLKLHRLTALLAVGPRRIGDALRKTRLLLNDAMPRSSVQPLGFDGGLLATLFPYYVPRPVARFLGHRAYGFFLQTEDGSHPDNRVAAGAGAPLLDYDARRLPGADTEHRALVHAFARRLAAAGWLPFWKRIGVEGTAHASGTLVAGSFADDSVVDAFGNVHGLDGLVVCDGSVLPRISRVNPALTIYAFALRAAERLARTLATVPAALEVTP